MNFTTVANHNQGSAKGKLYLFAEYKDKIDLVKFAQDVYGYPVQKEGDRCPAKYRNGDNPTSLKVNIRDFIDFGSQGEVHGDVFDFIMLHDGGSLQDALAKAAHYLGLTVPEIAPNAMRWADITADIEQWHTDLPLEFREYLHDRGITDQTIDELKLGKCTNASCNLDGRLVIPYRKGYRFVYAAGRAMTPEQEDQAKYKKLKRADFSFHPIWVAGAVGSSPHVYIAEGAFDAVTLYQLGLPVLSPITGAFSREQEIDLLSLIKGKKITICLDHDPQSKAGQKAMEKLGRFLFENGIVAHMVFLGDFLDEEARKVKIDINEAFVKGKDIPGMLAKGKGYVSHCIHALKDDPDRNEKLRDLLTRAAQFALWDDMEEWLGEAKQTGCWTDDRLRGLKGELKKAANKKSQNTAPAPRKAPVSDKPMLLLPGNGPTITECSEALYQKLATTGLYYRRSGRIVTTEELAGEIVLVEVKPDAMRSIPEEYFTIMAWRVGEKGKMVLKPTIMPRETAAAILECDARERLPEIRGLSGCSLMLADGRAIGPGFDAQSGILVTGGQMPPVVPLAQAIKSLARLLDDFLFVTPADKSRGLAAFLTAALRLGGFLRRCPALVIEADLSQTGKGYFLEVTAALYGEISRLVTQRQGGVGSQDESLGSRLAEGRPFIQLDNLRGKLDSPNLEALLTAEKSFPVRIPHRGEIMVDPSRFIISMTSNAAEMTPDLANRSYIVRLRKRPETYKFKQFAEGDLLAHVRANQPYYLGCIFAVLREWIAKGRLMAMKGYHDFRQWAGTLGWIIENTFHAPPLLDGHEDAKGRLANPDRSFVRALAMVVVTTGGENQHWKASALAELAEANDIKIPGLKDWNEGQAPRRVGMIMGRVLGNNTQVTIDEYVISVQEWQYLRPDGKGHFPGKVYWMKKAEEKS